MEWADWGKVAAAFVGGSVSGGLIVNEYVKHRLERQRAREDQQRTRDEQKRAEQRQVLLDLQAALYGYISALSNSVIQFKSQAAGQPLPALLHGVDWPVEARITGDRIVLLSARVHDEQLKGIVNLYLHAVAAFSSDAVKTADHIARAESTVWEMQKVANDRIGELLMTL